MSDNVYGIDKSKNLVDLESYVENIAETVAENILSSPIRLSIKYTDVEVTTSGTTETYDLGVGEILISGVQTISSPSATYYVNVAEDGNYMVFTAKSSSSNSVSNISSLGLPNSYSSINFTNVATNSEEVRLVTLQAVKEQGNSSDGYYSGIVLWLVLRVS